MRLSAARQTGRLRATETRHRSGADVMRAAARMAAVIRRRARGVRTAKYERLRPQGGVCHCPNALRRVMTASKERLDWQRQMKRR
jgi:hypothetical protein